ncbi:MAG: LysR family transcriptional regulator [Pseudomonadota bacterium]
MKSINIKTLDLNLLRLLVVLGEVGSVSRASALLGLSQPATSNALARLRIALDDPLFVRTRDGMVPTSFAETILPIIDSHLAGIVGTLENGYGFEPEKSNKLFRLSLSGLGETLLLPKLAIKILSSAPNIRIRNISVPFARLAETLEAGETELALGMIDIVERGFRSQVLFSERYVAIAGSGLKNKPANIIELRNKKILVSAPAATYAMDIEETISRNQLSENVVLRLAHFGAFPQLLNELDLVAIVPEQFAAEMEVLGHAENLGITLSEGPSDIKMVWHHRTEDDPACVWLRAHVAELYSVRDKNVLTSN